MPGNPQPMTVPKGDARCRYTIEGSRLAKDAYCGGVEEFGNQTNDCIVVSAVRPTGER